MTRPSRAAVVLGLVVGGIVLAVVAIVAIVLPAVLRGGPAENPADVADIASEPRETWTFDWVGDADAEFLEDTPVIAPVGDDKALIWASFDNYAFVDSQGNSTGWYEGYDEQYEDGYTAGEQWANDYDAFWQSTTLNLPYPDQKDYYPEGAYGDYEHWLGFDDGFYDAAYKHGEGNSKKEEPVAPDFSPSLTMLDTSSGDAEWTIDLAEAIDGVDYTSSFYAFDVPGSNAIGVSSSTTDGESSAYAIVTLSKSDGSVISQFDSEGPVGVVALDGELIVTASEADGSNGSIARFGVDSLGDEPEWRKDAPDSTVGATVATLGNEYVQVIGDEDGIVLEASTGRAADFGDDVDFSVSYYFAGGQLVRSENADDATTIEGWDDTGDSTWSKPVESDYARVIDGTIFAAKADGDSYTGLEAIDPSTGEPLWSKPLAKDFDGIYGVRNGSVLVISGSTLIVLDAGSGEPRFSQKLGDLSAFYEGTNAYYVYTGDELAAFGYGEKGALWSLDIGDDQAVIAIGRTLGLIDLDKGTLRGLA